MTAHSLWRSGTASSRAMRRFAVLAGFWLLGFLVGFAGYIVLARLGFGELIVESLYNVLRDSSMAEGLLVGVATGFISVGSIILWAFTRAE